MNIELIAQSLEGYLLSLRRLTGNRCDFWSFMVPLDGGIEESLEAHFARINAGATILGKAFIGYAELEALLRDHLLSKLEAGEKSHFELFTWDITEFIQMSYRELESESDPLRTREAISFDARSEFHGNHVYIVIPVQDEALVIGLGARA
jgi:hypothetical protein